METYSVYITTNMLNNKAYVGMTNGHLKNYMGSDKILLNDLRIIGRKNFSKSFLFTSTDYKETHYWEGFYIRTLKTHVSQGGYNPSWNGGIYIPMTEEKKKNCSKGMMGKNKGKKQSKEWIEKRVQQFRGKKQTKEIIEKRITPLRGSKRTEIQKEHMKLTCYKGQKCFGNNNKIQCPYCNKSCSSGVYKRWHGDRCKQKPNI